MFNIIKLCFLFISFSSLLFGANFNNSIYNLDIDLIDKNGRNIKFNSLKGDIHVFSMIYTNCKTICPIIISNMKKIENILEKKKIKNVKFTLFSLDPERDSVESINKFFLDKKLTENKWNIYLTNKYNVLKIALLTGIKYKKENDDIIHSNLIILIDQDGIINYYHQGLDQNFEDFIKNIEKLL